MRKSETSELLSAYKTRKSLLLRLKEKSDDRSWREFYGIYGRMIFGYALRYRLNHSEAEDIVQEVCVKLFRQILSFDYSPDQGHFRGWLKTVTKHAVIDFVRRKERRMNHLDAYRDHHEVMEEEKNSQADALWQMEWEKALLSEALRRVNERISERTREIFQLFVVENIPANEVGERLGIEANAVYACKHRMLKMIRDEIEIMKDEL